MVSQRGEPAEFKLHTEGKRGQEAGFGDFLTSGCGGAEARFGGRVKREWQRGGKKSQCHPLLGGVWP